MPAVLSFEVIETVENRVEIVLEALGLLVAKALRSSGLALLRVIS
jgi:hypothetical protein